MSAKAPKRRVLVITGSRSEFGLLQPVMRAVRKHKKLNLLVAVAGEHLLSPANTWKEVAREFRIDAKVPMQRRTDRGRIDHAAATARGMAGFAAAYKKLKPDWVVVLGDRIEAFAAASAASIAGIAVCHIHGGDRAEGIADEAMRHAITKLAHLHCAATAESSRRLMRMGEPKTFVRRVGSPAIDDVGATPPVERAELGAWKDVCTLVLLHPCGPSRRDDEKMIQSLIAAVDEAAPGDVLALAPNHDPGRDIILKHLRRRISTPNDRVRHYSLPDGSSRLDVLPRPSSTAAANIGDRCWFLCQNMPRPTFLGLLKALEQAHYGLIVGNSSAGLIEAAAIGMSVLNVGSRQAGRERAGWVNDVPQPDSEAMIEAINGLMSAAESRRVYPRKKVRHPYGDGRAGPRIAALLAKTNPHDPALLRKRNSY